MTKKNFLTGKDKELFDLAEKFEKYKDQDSLFYLDGEDWADLANWYAFRNQHQLANEAVQQGLLQHPDHTGLLVEQAYLCMDARQYDAADNIISCIKDPTQPEVVILKATLLLETGEIEQAEDILKPLEQEDDLSNIIEIAYLFLEHNLPEKARFWLQKGNKFEKATAYLGVLGDFYLATGENEKAENIFNELIDRNPYSAPYWQALAQTYMAMNKPEKAIEACDFAIVADREYGEAYMIRAQAYLALDNEEKATEDNELAYKFGALEEDCYLMIKALQFIEREEWEKAYNLLMQVLELDSMNSIPLEHVLHQIACCLHNMGKDKEALTYCVQAEQLDPDNIENYFLEGNIHLTLENDAYCKEAWQKAIDLDPSVKSWKRISDMSFEGKRADLALTALKKIEELDPSTPELYTLMASACLVLNEKKLFLKYNSLSDTPFTTQKLESIYHKMVAIGATKEAQILTEILKLMK